MFNVYRSFIDNGIDLNKDRHCDIEGWFVDKEGHHKPVLRDRGLAKLDKAFKNRYDLYEIVSSFDAKIKLGDLEIDLLHTYTLNEDGNYLSSPTVNKYLRENGRNEKRLNERIRQLDFILDGYTLKRDLNVFRGISIIDGKDYINDFLKLKPGMKFHDLGFTSTTYSQEKAIEYGLKDSKSFIFLDITLKKGSHCIPLFKNLTSEKEEFEILLKRKQIFIVKKVQTLKDKDSSYIYYIKVESSRW